MKLNPVKIKPFVKAYELRLEQQDAMLYRQGLYVRDALLCTVGNMFGGKSAKKIEYPKKPYGVGAKELTEEEIKKQRELLIANLNALKINHDLQKKNKGEVN